ncbi:MAG: DUF134 domain-containing protein [Prolixibacteraceae bacterium]
MPRPTIHRRVVNPPKMSGFKPFGMPLSELKVLELHFDEFESINLVNYQDMPQEAAAELMGISRPTFTRIYNRALKKIARAFVEGMAIRIEGGNVEFEKQWYKCQKCFKLFGGLENHIKCNGCNSFANNELIRINQ